MPQHSVVVNQLCSNGGAYWNVDDEEGRIGVYGNSFAKPTYLLLVGGGIKLIHFDDWDWAKEFFCTKKHLLKDFIIYRFDSDIGLMQVKCSGTESLEVLLWNMETQMRKESNGQQAEENS